MTRPKPQPKANQHAAQRQVERLLAKGPQACLQWLESLPDDQPIDLWPLLAWLEHAVWETAPTRGDGYSTSHRVAMEVEPLGKHATGQLRIRSYPPTPWSATSVTDLFVGVEGWAAEFYWRFRRWYMDQNGDSAQADTPVPARKLLRQMLAERGR